MKGILAAIDAENREISIQSPDFNWETRTFPYPESLKIGREWMLENAGKEVVVVIDENKQIASIELA